MLWISVLSHAEKGSLRVFWVFFARLQPCDLTTFQRPHPSIPSHIRIFTEKLRGTT
jgi:hypothetical protein